MSKITFPPLPEPTVNGTKMHPELKICYTAPVNYTAEQMQERDRQIAECVIRACAEIASSQSKFAAYAAGSTVQDRIAAAILAMLPVKEPKE